MATPSSPSGGGEEHVYLLTAATFEQYRDFLLKEVPDTGPNRLDRIAEDWHRADPYLERLGRSEATWADHPTVLPMPPELDPLVGRVRADPIFGKAFPLPVEFGLVELDRTVVYQELINLAQVERLKRQLSAAPTMAEVFRVCLPFDHPVIAPTARRHASDTFVFASLSNDLRMLESVLLRPEQVTGVQSHGPIVGIVGVLVGYGSNYLNAISSGGRLVLHNGSHRAYALRSIGLTHVPCIIQKAGGQAELNSVAAGNLRRNPDRYLQGPRPPVLKDFFDPQLIRRLRLAPVERHVKVRLTVDTYDVVTG